MQEINKQALKQFTMKVYRARQAKGLADLNAYDLMHYTQTLINSASIAHLYASMQCSDRMDLIENDPDESKVSAQELFETQCKLFALTYLGLELITQRDPRGAVFKLVVDSSIGDSFGSHEHLCVPCNDAYFCN